MRKASAILVRRLSKLIFRLSRSIFSDKFACQNDVTYNCTKMNSSIIALLLGLFAFVISVPILFPLVGCLFGLNALLKKPNPKDGKFAAVFAIILCVITIVV